MATEMFKSRSRRVGTEERMEYVYRTSTLPDAIFADPDIPSKGDLLTGRPWMTVVEISSERMTSNADGDYSIVKVVYSDHQELLQNPGDTKVEYDFTSRSESIRHAKQYTGWIYDADGKPQRQYRNGGALYPVGQDLDATTPRLAPHHVLRVIKLMDKAMLTEVFSAFYTLEGTVNDVTWKGYAPWTLLFHGAEVPQIGIDRYLATMTFEFDAANHFFTWYVEDKKTRETSELIRSETSVPGDFSILGLN